MPKSVAALTQDPTIAAFIVVLQCLASLAAARRGSIGTGTVARDRPALQVAHDKPEIAGSSAGGRTLRRTASPLSAPARYYNRELSWLQFNRRVLEEAQNLRHPLLERLRFLSISASNLDEFYMVRVAGLYGQVAAGVVQQSQDGLTPAQQLAQINRFAAGLVNDQQACWTALKAEMAAVGIVIVEPKELMPAERAWLDRQFLAHHLPILTPIAVDPAHPFPFIQNRGLTVGVELWRAARRQDDACPAADPEPARALHQAPCR